MDAGAEVSVRYEREEVRGMAVVAVNRATRGTDKRFVTADGYEIRDGARIYDYYDCQPVTISFELTGPEREYWDGWFTAVTDDGGTTLLDGSRLQGYAPGKVPPLEQPEREQRLRTLAGGGRVLVSDDVFEGRPREVEWKPRMTGDPAPFVCPESFRRYLPGQTVAEEVSAEETARRARAEVPVTDAQVAAVTELADAGESHLDRLELTASQLMRAVTVTLLRVDPDFEGNGHGRRALDVIMRWADEHGVTLLVTPGPMPAEGQRPLSKAWLHEWYRRAGFVRNRGRRVEHRERAAMLRHPQPVERG